MRVLKKDLLKSIEYYKQELIRADEFLSEEWFAHQETKRQLRELECKYSLLTSKQP